MNHPSPNPLEGERPASRSLLHAHAGTCNGALLLAALCAFAATCPCPAQTTTSPSRRASSDTAFYAGGAGETEFCSVFELSDKTLLITGGTTARGWLPPEAPRIQLTNGPGAGGDAGRVAFILHVSPDLARVLHVVQLPAGTANNVLSIRTTNLPGQKTGAITLACGTGSGYVLARLDHNFIDGAPAAIAWWRDVGFSGGKPAWDVDGEGNVTYMSGAPHSYDWYAVNAIDTLGRPRLVPDWRYHKVAGGDYFAGLAADATQPLSESIILFKRMRKPGTFRSWTRADFELKTSNGNGGTKMGKWPFDAMYNGYFDPATQETVPVLPGDTGRGYYGYKMADEGAELNALTIDRRTGDLYLGGCNKSKLPDGQPDFEPWVVALAKDGTLRWWQRLYDENKGVSTPDQFVDNLAIDYSQPPASGALVVNARAHGNNVNNLWRGDEVPANGKRGAFQNGWSGTKGNMHFSWLGRLALADGTLQACTYLAEYAEQDAGKFGNKPFAQANISHWPAFTSAWPDLNTTTVAHNGMAVDAAGCVYVCAIGRRVITTRGAFQEMPSPLQDPTAKGDWANFIRIYNPELTAPRYSSILAGQWDRTTGAGGSKADLRGCCPVDGGVVVVCIAPLDKAGAVSGNDMPTANVPAWGKATRASGTMAVVARLNIGSAR